MNKNPAGAQKKWKAGRGGISSGPLYFQINIPLFFFRVSAPFSAKTFLLIKCCAWRLGDYRFCFCVLNGDWVIGDGHWLGTRLDERIDPRLGGTPHHAMVHGDAETRHAGKTTHIVIETAKDE